MDAGDLFEELLNLPLEVRLYGTRWEAFLDDVAVRYQLPYDERPRLEITVKEE